MAEQPRVAEIYVGRVFNSFSGSDGAGGFDGIPGWAMNRSHISDTIDVFALLIGQEKIDFRKGPRKLDEVAEEYATLMLKSGVCSYNFHNGEEVPALGMYNVSELIGEKTFRETLDHKLKCQSKPI